MSIDTFQARFAFVNTDDGTLTPEAFRVLRTWFKRIGGFDSATNEDLEMLALQTLAPDVAAQRDIADLQLGHPIDQSAQLAALTHRCDELQAQLAAIGNLAGEITALRHHLSDNELMANYRDQFRVDWERPGKIGKARPNTGKFTTIGASAETRVTLPVAGVCYGMWSQSPNVNSRNWCIAISYGVFGNCQLRISTASGGDPDAAGVVVWNATATGLAITNGFGCNGKTAQTAAASGGAMATTAATNAAPFGFTTAAQAESIATKINTMQAALIANGIMS